MKSIIIISKCILGLGIVHLAATPMVFTFQRSTMHEWLPQLYFFEITGIAIIFSALFSIFIIKNTVELRLTKIILKYSAIFMLLVGFGAVASMWDNPFAYISVGLAIANGTFIYKYFQKGRV